MVDVLEKNHTDEKCNIEGMVFCPIFNNEIDDGFCYEINSVAFGLCTPDLINNATDRVIAKNSCNACVNRQM